MKKLLDLENSTYFALFLLPTYLIRIKAGFFSTNLFEIMVAGIFLAWLLRGRKKTEIAAFSQNSWLVVFPGLIFLGFFLSAVYNFFHSGILYHDFASFAHSLGAIKSWIFIPTLYLFLVRSLVPPNRRKNLLQAYYLSALFVAVLSLVYFVFGRVTYDGRLQGIFDSPNYLAMYLAPALVACAQIQNAKIKLQNFNSKFKIIFFFFSIALVLFAFYKTYSYAAWFSVALSILLMNFLSGNLFKFKKQTAVFSFFLTAVLVSQIGSDKFNRLLFFDERSSLASREMIWASAGKMLEDHWFFGIGPGNFQAFYLEYQRFFPPYLVWAVPHPHDLFLAVWLYGGILGLLGFLGLLWIFFRNILQKKDPERLAAFGIMLYFIFHGLVDTTVLKNDLAILFWLLFAFLEVYPVKLSIDPIDKK